MPSGRERDGETEDLSDRGAMSSLTAAAPDKPRDRSLVFVAMFARLAGERHGVRCMREAGA
jgi:hypothetical protein